MREALARPSDSAAPRLATRDRGGSFYALDALRGVAAIAVLMLHAAAMFRPVWMRSSYLAVDLFFVLSGFVLAHAYGGRLRDGLSAASFLRIRLIRILPLYFLGTTIAVATAVVQGAFGHSDWNTESLVRATAASVLMIPLPPDAGAPNGFAFPLNIPAWSLFFELLANFFYAAIFRVLTICRTVILIGLAFVALCLTAYDTGALQVGADWSTLWGGFPRVIFSFFVGVVLYRIRGRAHRARTITPWALMAGLFLTFVAPIPGDARWLFDLFCISTLFPLLIWHASCIIPGGPRQQAAFTLLGKTSYALYTIHVPLLGIAVALLADIGHGPQFLAPVTGLAFLVVAIATSLAADAYFDVPVRRLINGWMYPLVTRHV
jgi:peptidoglycan/LPS O-acetylase OafA/YrhL